MAKFPNTVHGLSPFTCISGLQKCVRRGMEKEAMEFAVEMIHSSRTYLGWLCNRLQIICHEDLDTISQPWLVPFVATACNQAKECYKPERPGASRMMLGNAIRLMCRAKKSREGDHFNAAIGLANLLEGKAPTVEDFMLDRHTLQGKKMGRGLDHFRKEATKLVPPPEFPDSYEDEAYRLFALKEKAARVNADEPEIPF